MACVRCVLTKSFPLTLHLKPNNFFCPHFELYIYVYSTFRYLGKKNDLNYPILNTYTATHMYVHSKQRFVFAFLKTKRKLRCIVYTSARRISNSTRLVFGGEINMLHPPINRRSLRSSPDIYLIRPLIFYAARRQPGPPARIARRHSNISFGNSYEPHRNAHGNILENNRSPVRLHIRIHNGTPTGHAQRDLLPRTAGGTRREVRHLSGVCEVCARKATSTKLDFYSLRIIFVFLKIITHIYIYTPNDSALA